MALWVGPHVFHLTGLAATFHLTEVEKAKSPLLGAWHLDAAHLATGPFVTNEGLPTTVFYIDTTARLAT